MIISIFVHRVPPRETRNTVEYKQKRKSIVLVENTIEYSRNFWTLSIEVAKI